jgi:hypothetical protein
LCYSSEAVGQMPHLLNDATPRCRRDLRRLPQELRKNRRPRSLLILLLSARQSRRHKSRLGCRLNAGVAQWAERHGCRESAARTWMSVQRGPTERRRSEGTRGTRAQPGARTLGYLVSFQVTRRRRNRSGVSQTPSHPHQSCMYTSRYIQDIPPTPHPITLPPRSPAK